MDRTKILGQIIINCEIYTNVLRLWIQCKRNHKLFTFELQKSFDCEINKNVNWNRLAKGLV